MKYHTLSLLILSLLYQSPLITTHLVIFWVLLTFWPVQIFFWFLGIFQAVRGRFNWKHGYWWLLDASTYDFRPVRLDFCNWEEIRASSMSISTKNWRRGEGRREGKDTQRNIRRPHLLWLSTARSLHAQSLRTGSSYRPLCISPLPSTMNPLFNFP